MKIDKKTSLKIAALSLIGTITITGLTGCKQNKTDNKNINSSISVYLDDLNENNSTDFNIKIEKYNSFLSQIETLSRVSAKLKKLESKFIDVEENKDIEMLSEEDIDYIISNYNKGTDLVNSLPILKKQYKIYNEKIYNLYNVLQNYSLCMAKLYIANDYNLNDPEQIIISNFSKNKNEYSANITYDDTTITMSSSYSDNDIKNILELISISNKIDSQNKIDINNIQSYNKERINLIKNNYNRVNEIYYEILKKDKVYFK